VGFWSERDLISFLTSSDLENKSKKPWSEPNSRTASLSKKANLISNIYISFLHLIKHQLQCMEIWRSMFHSLLCLITSNQIRPHSFFLSFKSSPLPPNTISRIVFHLSHTQEANFPGQKKFLSFPCFLFFVFFKERFLEKSSKLFSLNTDLAQFDPELPRRITDTFF